MSDTRTIFFAGGGTGGHLYPGIAVAQALKKVDPGAKAVFLCTTKEIDRVILEPTGFEWVAQPIVPPIKSISGLLRFWRAWRETKDLVQQKIREHRPVAVLGLGGYAAGVAVKFGSLKGIPTAIINPDVIPGSANRYLMKYTQAICCQFEQTAQHVFPEHRAKIKVTGCPIRPDIIEGARREEATAELGLDPTLQTLVVTGASLGAQTVNEAVLTMLEGLTLKGWQILHLSGREHAEKVRAGYRELNVPARVVDFTTEMSDVWSVADLAISRAGASSCAELTVRGIPSILMPYPYHKDLHQRANAKVLADVGAAVLIDDTKDRRQNALKLRPVVESLLYDIEKRRAMATAAKSLGRPNAAEAVAHIITQLVPSSR